MLKHVAAAALLVLVVSPCPTPGLLAQECPPDSIGQRTPAKVEAALERELSREELLETLERIHGERARRLFRVAYWAAGLQGDMKAVFDSYGYPSSRYREVKAGITYERWTYLDLGKQFVFRGCRLTRTRDFNPASAAGLAVR